MKLYVCWTERELNIPGRTHPCAEAHDALTSGGHEPEVIQARSFGALPSFLQTGARKRVKANTGSNWVPALELDDGGWVRGAEEIQEWARANPAPAAGT